jgi:hypothetical protein
MHVKMTTPKSDEHASQVMEVMSYIKSEPACQEHIKEDFYEYMTKYAEKCRKGEFEELMVVNAFVFKGKDSSGLNVYWRLKGARAENIHHKLHVGVGPFGIGIKSAQNILLNMIFVIMSTQALQGAVSQILGTRGTSIKTEFKTASKKFGGVLFMCTMSISSPSNQLNSLPSD